VHAFFLVVDAVVRRADSDQVPDLDGQVTVLDDVASNQGSLGKSKDVEVHLAEDEVVLQFGAGCFALLGDALKH